MLDANGDYVFGNSEQDFLVDSPACVAQAISTALQLLQGEWFLDTTAGVPWLTEVIGLGTGATYDTVIKNAILGVQGVQDIASYTSVLDGTTLVVSAVVDSVYGQASVNNLTLSIP
jgi:hypothetical protein